jgi:hypothetical protein
MLIPLVVSENIHGQKSTGEEENNKKQNKNNMFPKLCGT